MMTGKGTVFSLGIILWALGMLAGGSAVQVLPGKASVIPPAVVLIVALLAAGANLVFLYKKVQSL